DQFRRVFASALDIAQGPQAILDPQIAALAPAQFQQPLQERREPNLHVRIVRSSRHEHADAPHLIALLRARRERPRGRTAHQRDELAPFHSITSSAMASSLSGTWRPSALAVLRLMASSNFVGC